MAKTDVAKMEYMEEHIPYELLMLRHTYQQMKSSNNQLDWNAFFESFCLHARNLYKFLRNDRVNTTFVAVDFTEELSGA